VTYSTGAAASTILFGAKRNKRIWLVVWLTNILKDKMIAYTVLREREYSLFSEIKIAAFPKLGRGLEDTGKVV
jgi:hypothetical protein